MKTVYFILFVAFSMENVCASAQQYTVSACKDGVLLLNCRFGLIQVHDVILGDSRCSGRNCCPRVTDCHKAPSFTYRIQVHTTCNGRSSCSMSVEIRNIGCSRWGPNNDYTNITYSCIAIQTSPTPTILTMPFPTTPSSSSASTWQPSTKSTSTPINTTPANNKAIKMGQQSTPSTSAPINTPSYAVDDKKTTEIEKEEGEMTTSQSFVEESTSTKLNPTLPQKLGEATSGSKQGESASHVQTDQEDKDNGYLAIQTSPTPTILTMPFPTTPSSSSASTRQHSTTSTSTPINTTPANNKAIKMGQQSTPSTSAPINTPSYTADNKKATEIEKEEGEMTTSQSSVEESTKLNPTLPQKLGEATSGSKQGKSASQVKTDQEDKDNGYLDRLTTLVSVIVGGVVITATVISVAVVLALKKRSIAKIEEHYDLPNYSRNANNEDDNVRNSKIYEFIPDSDNCIERESTSVDCTAKESDYLTPVMESENAQYLWIL